MSEHRRKPPQPHGGRAAARRAAKRSAPGRRAAQPRDVQTTSHGESLDRPYGGRAEARRAARATGGRRGDSGGGSRGGGGYGGGRGGGSRGRGRGRPEPSGRKRFIDYPRSDRDGLRRWIPSWKQILLALLLALALLVVLAGVALAMVGVPDPNAVAQAQKNVYYWDDDEQMVAAGGGDQNRQIVAMADIPKSMQNAVISAENETFYQDRGVDPVGILRAVGRMALGGETQSGSTITQQYVKNTYLDQSQTITRKVKELLISVKVGATEEKSKILEGYLNTAYYGRGAYGIQAAARAYYGVDSRDLEPDQSAFLTALVNGPNYYDPAGGIGASASPEENRERAEERWKWILDREVETGRMSSAERSQYTKFPMPKKPTKATDLQGQKGYLVELANNYITANTDITERQLQQGGYKIYTTFDRKRTALLEKAVNDVRKANLKPEQRKEDKFVQFGGASVVPGDGAITAIYGGEDATKHFVNNADYTGVQVGSTFKPFVMAAALRDGKRDPTGPAQQPASMRMPVSPRSVYNGDNEVKLRDYDGQIWFDKEGKEWHQRNDDDTDYGRISLIKAMEVSANTPFIQLGVDVGTETVKQAAIDAGIRDDGSSFARLSPTFSLGTSAPSAIRLASAYSTFATSGLQADPYSVIKVEKDGVEVFSHEKKTKRAFEPAVADNVTSMLENVVENGTGTSAQLPDGRPAAGKTGTTDANRSAWFSGYTRQLATAIGMWRIDSSTEGAEYLPMYGTGGQESIHGASFPAEIWQEYMAQASAGMPIEEFPDPEPIGEKVYGVGASPSPTPTPSSTPSESASPEEEEEPEPTSSPSQAPSSDTAGEPTGSCSDLDLTCPDDGGSTEDPGNTEGADSGGSTSDGSGDTEGTDTGGEEGTTGSGSSNGNGNGSGGGGLFGSSDE